jgi:hypothetical protein
MIMHPPRVSLSSSLLPSWQSVLGGLSTIRTLARNGLLGGRSFLVAQRLLNSCQLIGSSLRRYTGLIRGDSVYPIRFTRVHVLLGTPRILSQRHRAPCVLCLLCENVHWIEHLGKNPRKVNITAMASPCIRVRFVVYAGQYSVLGRLLFAYIIAVRGSPHCDSSTSARRSKSRSIPAARFGTSKEVAPLRSVVAALADLG